MKKKIILIMAGGTGGHVFPGLAVAQSLQEQGYQVCWLGTPQGIESTLVPSAGISLEYISINGLRGKSWRSLLVAPWKLSKAILQAISIMRRIQPYAVVGMGGFAAGPGGIAAYLLNKPLIIHEQNAVAGYTNRMLALLAQRVLMSFPNVFPDRSKNKITGNPLRKEFFTKPDPAQRFAYRKGAFRLLILGGSQGAAALNKTVPAALAILKGMQGTYPIELEVRHSTGAQALDETQQTYQELGIPVELHPFITDMAEAYAWADLCICRAGALTVAEICAIGVGAIFSPVPAAVDDHQTKNAEPLVAKGAAKIIQQKDLTAQGLAHLLAELMSNDRAILLEMAQKAQQLSYQQATDQVVKQIIEVCNAAN